MKKVNVEFLKNKQFNTKNSPIQNLYLETLKILQCFGYPTNMPPRRLEKTIGAFLALCDVKNISELTRPKDLDTVHKLTTRAIIEWENKFLEENISSGSYDDIRRKDLKLLVLGDIVLKSSPNSATNDSTRGYGVNPLYSKLMELYGSENWEEKIAENLTNIKPLKLKLDRKRRIKQIPVTLPTGEKLLFSNGDHNKLQKKIIEKFLPRYGYKAELLYVGDTSNKYLYLNENRIKKLGLPEMSHNDLPDILAYSHDKKWIYLIEAVYSSGPISETRLLHLKNITKYAKREIVYITAFLDTKTFKKFAHEIAWETEVWISANPDHMIHFNGDKFIGPYKG